MTTTPHSKVPKADLRRTIAVVVGAGLPALLYLLYIFHYSVNVPNGDDWFVIPIADASLHGHLTLSALWSQYGDTRLFFSYLIFAAFAHLDHLNEKSIILFNAVLFIASYVLLLLLFRSYLGRRLTPFCFVLGLVWFSLADIQNALWSFQLCWYLTVFFFVAMMYVLLVPERHRALLFGFGIAAAAAGSLSDIQGFTLWPVGVICILWARPWVRRTYCELAIWVAAATATLLVYLPGYRSHYSTCFPRTPTCSLTFGLLHPDRLAKFFVLLVGNVIPTSLLDVDPGYVGVHQLLGVVISIVAAFVVVQSIRERRSHGGPLPLLLIVFALLFDVNIALGRVGQGLLGAVNDADRYTMPNILMLVGIVVYAGAHIPKLRKADGSIDWPGWPRSVGIAVLAMFIVVQAILTTNFGITNAAATQRERQSAARIVVNLDEVPRVQRPCYFGGQLFGLLNPWRLVAMRDRLSVFQPQVALRYSAEGPPYLSQCAKALYITTQSLPRGTLGTPYSSALAATGGDYPYEWSLVRYFGSLPKGLTLDVSSGVISGVPQAIGTFTFYVQVFDHSPKRTQSDSQGFSITIS
jgi:hypothetical protein